MGGLNVADGYASVVRKLGLLLIASNTRAQRFIRHIAMFWHKPNVLGIPK